MKNQTHNNKRNCFHLLLLSFFLLIVPAIIESKSTEDSIKEKIDSFSDSLKSTVDRIGDNIESVQDYLDNYHWKGVLQSKATSGPATLENLQLNGHKAVVAVKPGERILGEVDCNLDPEACASFRYYRVVLGIKGCGAQTTVGNSLGINANNSRDRFALIAPSEPGLYQIRFKTVKAFFETEALNEWLDDNGNEPDGTTTIGLIVVK